MNDIRLTVNFSATIRFLWQAVLFVSYLWLFAGGIILIVYFFIPSLPVEPGRPYLLRFGLAGLIVSYAKLLGWAGQQ